MVIARYPDLPRPDPRDAEITRLRTALSVAREALQTIRDHCANTGARNPVVADRIIDRCEETAIDALKATETQG